MYILMMEFPIPIVINATANMSDIMSTNNPKLGLHISRYRASVPSKLHSVNHKIKSETSKTVPVSVPMDCDCNIGKMNYSRISRKEKIGYRANNSGK